MFQGQIDRYNHTRALWHKQETTRRRLGNREMTITKRTAPDGTETIEEKFINVDPNDREGFEREWATRRGGNRPVASVLGLPSTQQPESDTAGTLRRRGWLDWLWGKKE